MEVGFLDPDTLKQLSIDSELLEELQSAAEYTLIAATFVEQRPISFCYAASETESLWDISIDTLPDYRRQGYAGLCVAHMIAHMAGHGKQPIWAAVEENPASWQLAQKLGFVPMDELALFELPKSIN
jgi:predicted GNAT family acetyltransferase